MAKDLFVNRNEGNGPAATRKKNLSTALADDLTENTNKEHLEIYEWIWKLLKNHVHTLEESFTASPSSYFTI